MKGNWIVLAALVFSRVLGKHEKEVILLPACIVEELEAILKRNKAC